MVCYYRREHNKHVLPVTYRQHIQGQVQGKQQQQQQQPKIISKKLLMTVILPLIMSMK